MGSTARYQQAYNASGFTSLGAISVDSIEFYLPDGSSGTYAFYLSTITAGIGTVTTSFTFFSWLILLVFPPFSVISQRGFPPPSCND